VLECVINISEGRRRSVVDLVARNAGRGLLDVHVDPDHHRSVLTVVGEEAARAVAAAAVLALDLRAHQGAHPRLGVVDVVPFVPLGGASLADAVAARDRWAAWMAHELGVPCFLYGPERSLPEVRRRAFVDLAPDLAPPAVAGDAAGDPVAPHPTAGATAVGARPPLVAYNVWVADPDPAVARSVAAAVRGPGLRALGMVTGDHTQVSMNLIDPEALGPADAYDRVADAVADAGGRVLRAELVGLVPEAVLARVPSARWDELDLSADRTIEARLAAQGWPLS
jgi:glutamate formiminotransferase